jgi:putative flippase GtrA
LKLPAAIRDREVHAFVLVGVLATTCYATVTFAAIQFGHLGSMAAGLIGYLVSVGISYFGNSVFTFRRPAMHGLQFARFATISLAGLAINQGITFVTVHEWGWPKLLAIIPVVLIVPASTFAMSKFWAFRKMEAAG